MTKTLTNDIISMYLMLLVRYVDADVIMMMMIMMVMVIR